MTLLHISDTHMLHRTLQPQHMRAADILVHTGDFTNNGSEAEFADFNDWLGEQRPRYKNIVVICGNHEFRVHPLHPDALSPEFARRRLPNATHVLHHEMATIEGINFFGSPWCPWSEHEDPDLPPYHAALQDVLAQWAQSPHARRYLDASGTCPAHLFDHIPADAGIDVLLTHGPPRGILDEMEGTSRSWGSSRRLRARIEGGGLTLGAHLFGHLHEQRGYWQKARATSAPCASGWEGGCEYEVEPGVKWSTFAPPPAAYACSLISCNAMKNHGGLDRRPPCIAGAPRLIRATKPAAPAAARWSFSVCA